MGTRTYCSTVGAPFTFRFEQTRTGVDVYCVSHPSLQGRDSNPHKTHLYPSGRLCFVAGREPKSLSQAQTLAAAWAEFLVRYIRTGIAEG